MCFCQDDISKIVSRCKKHELVYLLYLYYLFSLVYKHILYLYSFSLLIFCIFIIFSHWFVSTSCIFFPIGLYTLPVGLM